MHLSFSSLSDFLPALLPQEDEETDCCGDYHDLQLFSRNYYLFLARLQSLRPWPNDSIFHLSVSSTFDLKVEPLLSVVEHVWPNDSIFRTIFLSTFQLLILPQRVSAKNIYHDLYLQANETLLRMLSLDFLDKVAKRFDFHSTTVLLLHFLDKDQTSLNITRLYLTHSTRWSNGSIFCRVKIRVKN